MLKGLMFVLLGFIIGITVTAHAITESGGGEALKVCVYGKLNDVLVPVLVDSNGVLQIN